MVCGIGLNTYFYATSQFGTFAMPQACWEMFFLKCKIAIADAVFQARQIRKENAL